MDVLRIDPQPQFALSPYLYMQFMEPLGTTDSSVEAAWDFQQQEWRQDVVQVTQDLGPTLIRWGGCLSSYYLWQEGVGPRDQRRPMPNLLWGGIESNQVGTHEFVSFCRQVGAEPLLSVNFESDGRQGWAIRSAGPADAASWVDYCNNPQNTERHTHGHPEPYDVRLWQIGNETSYDPNGFDCEVAARKTVAFAEAMRKADPEIALIGWGDSGWAKRMLEIAGEYLQYLAFHNMFRAGSDQENSPLQGMDYRRDWDETWEHLMDAYRGPEQKIQRVREETADTDIPLAITECHFSLPGRNRCEVLSTWAAGVANARILNVHERNGDRVKIATLADFCGTRWLVNAVMIVTPQGAARPGRQTYLMPVAHVMRLYRHHSGEQAVGVDGMPVGLDVTASRTGDRLFLHVVNTRRTASVRAQLAVDGYEIQSGSAYEIATDPTFEIMETCATVLDPVKKEIPAGGQWTFPPASVTAVELDLTAARSSGVQG